MQRLYITLLSNNAGIPPKEKGDVMKDPFVHWIEMNSLAKYKAEQREKLNQIVKWGSIWCIFMIIFLRLAYLW